MGKMKQDDTILREHVEKLGLDKKTTDITASDQAELVASLYKARERELADYVEKLKHPGELQDLIVNTLYG
jgi:hypothetical protein